MNITQRVTLAIPDNVLKQLDAFAFSRHRSRSNAATLLLAEALAGRTASPRNGAHEQHARHA